MAVIIWRITKELLEKAVPPCQVKLYYDGQDLGKKINGDQINGDDIDHDCVEGGHVDGNYVDGNEAKKKAMIESHPDKPASNLMT